MKFAPNCGRLITSSSSASWARQNDAAKIDITPHKIGTGKIVFMWLSWNAEAGRSTKLTFLRSNRLSVRVRERGHPPKSIPCLHPQYLQRSNCRREAAARAAADSRLGTSIDAGYRLTYNL